MKKLFLILISSLFWGCEKFELMTDPYHKFNGMWQIKSIRFNIINCINCNTNDSTSLKLLNVDTVALSAFKFNGTQNGMIKLSQDISKTPFSRIFVVNNNAVNSTKWEFETYEMSTFYDQTTTGKKDCWVNFYPNSSETGYVEITDLKQIGTRPPMSTKWLYKLEGGVGVSPADFLTLSSPPVTTDLLLENRMVEKVITYKLIIEFIR